jgi:MFS family permease
MAPSFKRRTSNLLSAVPATIRSLIIVLSLNALSIGYLLIYVTAFLPRVGVSSTLIGTILGVEGITLVIVGIPLGILSDRKGRKWILIFSSLGITPVYFILALTREPAFLILAGMIAGVAEGGFLATVNAIIADNTRSEGRNSAFSFSFILSTIFSGAGYALPLIFPLIEGPLGITVVSLHVDILLIIGGISLMLPLVLLYILRTYSMSRNPEPSSVFRTTGLKNLAKFSGANSLIGLGAGFIIPLIATWFYLRYAIPDTYSGPLLAVANITIGLSAILSPRMARSLGNVRAIVVNEVVATVFMLALAFVVSPLLAASLYVVRAALMNMSSPLADSFLMSIVPSDQRGLASAINNIVWRLPNSATTIIGGAILASGNYSLPFELAAGFYALSIALFYLFFRNYKVTISQAGL